MKAYASSEAWFLYREAPFRVLYAAGLGFQEPPTKLQLSTMREKERARWNVWLFTDRSLAYELARGMSRAERVNVGERSELSRSGNHNSAKPKPKLTKGLASLA